jgi:hypothetical protein
MISRRRFLLAATLGLPAMARAQAPLEALRFSALAPGAALPDWLEHITFRGRPRHTDYALVADQGRTVLRARADAATSGVGRELRVDPAAYPVLAWRWKVMNLVQRGDLRTKEGDDFPARLYLRFGRRALCYVWDTRLPVGTMASNAWSDRVHMVVADSGAALLGQWVERERDYAADYRRAFGEAPPAVSALIVSADTDNTGERAESYFGDVWFRPRG